MPSFSFAASPRAVLPATLRRYGLLVALALVFGAFSVTVPAFLNGANLLGMLVNNFSLLAIVAVAMTLVVSAGGIDLSVGTAIDMAALTYISLVAAHHPVGVALLGAIGAGVLTGLFNAILIAWLRISPFLATLGTLFVGRSAQQLLTDGGNPVYVAASALPAAFVALGHGTLWGLPVPLCIVAAVLLLAWGLSAHTAFGRRLAANGVQPEVARYAGLPVARDIAWVFVVSGVLCSVAAIVLSSTIGAYVPLSGNAFLLNAIGATYIGTTMHPEARPNIPGTILGVLFLNIVNNGLLLVGWSFYWQQVASGVLIFGVLAVSFTKPQGSH